MQELRIRTWDEHTLYTSEVQWQRLLQDSAADPLFLGWTWLSHWWRVFGQVPGCELCLLAAYDDDGELVGLAPLYLQAARLRGWLPLRRLQFLGHGWRQAECARSEYLDFIAARGREREVVTAFLEYILEHVEWDEFVLANLPQHSLTHALLAAPQWQRGCLVRWLEPGESLGLRLHGNFQGYLAGLGAKTRGKVYNQRKRLAASAPVRLVATAVDEVDRALEVLNEFHRRRWGRPVFQGRRLSFHRAVARALAERGELGFTVLYAGDTPLSALYDFHVAGVKYGYQMGFDAGYDRHLSPALLHMGYAIEQAYAEGLHTYDFLRGAGKSTPLYKEHLAGPLHPLVSVQLVRHPALRWLYRTHGWLARWRPAPAAEEAKDERVG
ncbi:MAG TPA: GNAT family N-acetyltransferase [Candidatus Competibacteraceae bacterium]|nr:GNAT family N-acetyltransferase [Candidatus Competibacteraceae bacterium]